MEISQWQEGKNSFSYVSPRLGKGISLLNDDLWYSVLFNVYVNLFLKAKIYLNTLHV